MKRELSQPVIGLICLILTSAVALPSETRATALAAGLHVPWRNGRSRIMRAPGDRRSRIRFEVFGAFWGTFDAGDAVRVHNLTQQGALIEAHQPLAIESIQSVCLMLDGQPAVAHARVRHVQPSGDRGFLVGVEFLTMSTAFLEAVDRLMTFRTFPTEHA